MRIMKYAEKFEMYRAAIEKELEGAIVCAEEKCEGLAEAMRYSLLGGGKRIRAALTLEFCDIYGGDWTRALKSAAAIEMIHAYSLIHDDLPCMDDDDFRRGRPSCHKKYGEAQALLAGDALLTYAFEYIAKSEGVDAEKLIRVVSETAALAGYEGMAGGQYIDLGSEGKDIDEYTLKTMHRLKTGAMIRLSGRCGAIIGGAGEEGINDADKYCAKIGLAFQITDDILDIIGDEKLLGKPVQSDKGNDKKTYASMYGIENAQKMAEKLFSEARECIEKIAPKDDFLSGLTDFLESRKM